MKFDIFNNFPYRTYIRDENHHIVYANELACIFLELDYIEIIEKEYDHIFLDENFISHLKKIDKEIFSEKFKSLTSIHEYNRCYNEETIFKVIEYLYTNKNEKFIITILVDISDTYSIESGIDLKIGEYDPCNRLIKLKNGSIQSLTRLENSFLFLLYEKKGQTATYEEIFSVLDTNNTMDKVSLKSLIYRLKRKLSENIIENISMQGYRISIFN